MYNYQFHVIEEEKVTKLLSSFIRNLLIFNLFQLPLANFSQLATATKIPLCGSWPNSNGYSIMVSLLVDPMHTFCPLSRLPVDAEAENIMVAFCPYTKTYLNWKEILTLEVRLWPTGDSCEKIIHFSLSSSPMHRHSWETVKIRVLKKKTHKTGQSITFSIMYWLVWECTPESALPSFQPNFPLPSPQLSRILLLNKALPLSHCFRPYF